MYLDVSNIAEYDEINMLMEQLGSQWGSVIINCDGEKCVVSDPHGNFYFSAPMLIDALRMAAEEEVE